MRVASGVIGVLLAAASCGGKTTPGAAAMPQSAAEVMTMVGFGPGPTEIVEHEPSDERKAILADLDPVWIERTRIANMVVGEHSYFRNRTDDASGPATRDNTHPVIIVLGDRDGSTGPDADRDGIADDAERAIGTDPDKVDSDGDTLPDSFEAFGCLTRPDLADSDGDGTADNEEFDLDDPHTYLDNDQDGLLNGQERAEFNSDPDALDSDGDSFADGAEYFFGTNLEEANANADGDGFPDDYEDAAGADPADTDDDSIPDWLDPNTLSRARVEGRHNAVVEANSVDCSTNSVGGDRV